MAYKFNPFTGNLDEVSAGGGGGTPGGSNTQVQFNDSSAFGGDAGLVFNKTTNKLTTGGDVELNDGGTYATTLQVITPTTNRTISFPDATGTVALVAGSSGQLFYNNAGVNAGAGGSVVGATGDINLSLNGAASTPPLELTGTWFTGGTSTTTKSQLLIEPTGTTSTAWSTSGTGIGVNAASGFAGNLLDLQVNGTQQASFLSTGDLNIRPGQDGGSLYFVNTGHGLRYQGGNDFRLGHGDFGSNYLTIGSSGLSLGGLKSIGFCSESTVGNPTIRDVLISRDAANTLAQRNSTAAQTFRVYGTYTDDSNHVRASLSSSSTAVTLAAETAGTGADNIPLNLTAAGTGTIKVNSVAEVVVSSTVAGLPAAPVVGMLTRVTNALAPAVGTTVAGGGAAAALCWYNGTNWTVIGV